MFRVKSIRQIGLSLRAAALIYRPILSLPYVPRPLAIISIPRYLYCRSTNFPQICGGIPFLSPNRIHPITGVLMPDPRPDRPVDRPASDRPTSSPSTDVSAPSDAPAPAPATQTSEGGTPVQATAVPTQAAAASGTQAKPTDLTADIVAAVRADLSRTPAGAAASPLGPFPAIVADHIGDLLPAVAKAGIDLAVSRLGGSAEAAVGARRDLIRRVVSDATLTFARRIIDGLAGQSA
jgi:hypothetical protein